MMRIALFLAASAACSQDTSNLDRKLDQLSTKIAAIDQKLNVLAGKAPQRNRRPEPDPKQVYAVPIEGNPVAGANDALVTIVEGYEYACPACRGARDTVAGLRAKYGDKVRVVYKQYIVHPDLATNASIAACAAHRQGKFEAMDKVLWEKGYANNRDFSPAKI